MRSLWVCVLIGLLLCVSAFAADAPVPVAQDVSLQQVQQQMSIVIRKEVQDSEKRVNDNMDANFKYFDERFHSLARTVLLKLFAGVVGSMTLILVGYAWLVTFVTRKYTTVYQRNILKEKMSVAMRAGKVLMPGVASSFAGIAPGVDPALYPKANHRFYHEPIFKQSSILGERPEPAPAAPLEEPAPLYADEKKSSVWKAFAALIMLIVMVALVIYVVLHYKGVV